MKRPTPAIIVALTVFMLLLATQTTGAQPATQDRSDFLLVEVFLWTSRTGISFEAELRFTTPDRHNTTYMINETDYYARMYEMWLHQEGLWTVTLTASYQGNQTCTLVGELCFYPSCEWEIREATEPDHPLTITLTYDYDDSPPVIPTTAFGFGEFDLQFLIHTTLSILAFACIVYTFKLYTRGRQRLRRGLDLDPPIERRHRRRRDARITPERQAADMTAEAEFSPAEAEGRITHITDIETYQAFISSIQSATAEKPAEQEKSVCLSDTPTPSCFGSHQPKEPRCQRCWVTVECRIESEDDCISVKIVK